MTEAPVSHRIDACLSIVAIGNSEMTALLEMLAFIAIVLAAIYLLVLAKVSLFTPAKASTFLLGHAATARLHYLELGIRIVLGVAFVIRARLMVFPEIFIIFGWVLIGTTASLLLIPWQWHRRFTLNAVPHALRHLKLVAICALVFGGFILFCALSTYTS